MRLLWLALAGAAGTVARYLVGEALARGRGAFPVGTLAVNVSGSFVLGVLFVVLGSRIGVSSGVRTAVLVGLLGGYTTYSTFSLETVRLLEADAVGLAVSYVVLTVAGGVAAAWLGVAVGRAV